ncbi:FAD binding domain protein [Mycobacterium kansasii]|uniref:FAD binding domain protein n=1 Tax=Mycobacterium kansasii TaxID=1768 RepID=A0A1V3WQR0_MYCKA|nr:FAD binding domain protein [Mycobacterium kansasii]
MLATGGIGKSFKVTSNSWEYTGDGHALALRAGASLINMEFVQFHPTGMVWPPSVKGILVTEGVRGDGGVLKNSENSRFMFDYIPPVFKGQYAESEQEADQWLKDNDSARRTPDLLPAMRLRGRSTPKSKPVGAPRTAASTSTSLPG